MKYAKPSKSIQGQKKLLVSCGMSVRDHARAFSLLGLINLCTFNYLVIIEYLKSVINPTGQGKSPLMSLLGTVSESDLRAMGIPVDWRGREPWVGVG